MSGPTLSAVFSEKANAFLALEQLIERTSEEFSRLAKFLGIPDFPEMLPKRVM